jgi:hypothetical protein
VSVKEPSVGAGRYVLRLVWAKRRWASRKVGAEVHRLTPRRHGDDATDVLAARERVGRVHVDAERALVDHRRAQLHQLEERLVDAFPYVALEPLHRPGRLRRELHPLGHDHSSVGGTTQIVPSSIRRCRTTRCDRRAAGCARLVA